MANQPKKYQKFVATAATATLVAAAIVPTASAAGFNDTSNYDKETLAELDRAVELGFVKGFENGDFKPADYVTRGQVAKILARHIAAEEGYDTDLNGLKKYVEDFEITDGFSDVSEKRDSELYFASLIVKDAEVFTGNEKQQLLPEKNITRQQMAKVLVNAFGLEGTDEEVEISDLDKATKEFQEYIVILAQNGVTKANPYKPGEAVKRIQMASFSVRAYDASPAADLVEVAALEVKDATTLAVSVTEANKDLTAENFKVQVDGKEVEVKAVASNGDGSIHTLTIASLDGKKGEVEVNGVKKAYDFTATVVESIKAINASELQVHFSQAVDATSAKNVKNYNIKINNNEIKETDIADIAVSKDGKVATILLDQTEVAFRNGDKYVVQTNDAILSKEGKKIEKFVTTEATFSETAAPTLVKTSYGNDKLTFTFDRPVDANTPVSLVKVDGIDIDNAKLVPVSKHEANNKVALKTAGDYSYTVDIVKSEAKAQAKKLGEHEVVIFDVQDTALANPSKASVLTGSYTVTDQVTAPEVTGIEAVNANRIFVHTNTSVDLTNANVQVNKGAHTFTKGTGSISTSTETETYAEAGSKDGKPGIWVVVTDAKKGEANPLYRANEASVDLTVTVENYSKDGLIGKKSTQNVTLTKNDTKPVVENTVLKKDNTNNNIDTLVVTFTNELAKIDGTALAALASDDFVVRNKEGIIVTNLAANVDKKEIKITSTTNQELKDAPYTVEFKEGKFKNLEDRNNVATYLANTVKNPTFTVSVGTEVGSNFQYKEFDAQNNSSVDLLNNSLTINYPAEMSDSARDVANYTLDGKALPAGTTVDFIGNRETVKIVFPKNTFTNDTKYKLGITTNVKTESGSIIVDSLQTKAPAEIIFDVKDNVKPELASAVYYVGTNEINSKTTTDQIEVTFNEAIKFDAAKAPEQDFAVEINGSLNKVTAVETVAGKNTKLKLTLTKPVSVSQASTITIVPEANKETIKETAVTDMANNKAKEGSSVVLEAGKTEFNLSMAQTQADKLLQEAKVIIDGETFTEDTNLGRGENTVEFQKQVDALGLNEAVVAKVKIDNNQYVVELSTANTNTVIKKDLATVNTFK